MDASLSWAFCAKLPRVPFAHKLHTVFLLQTSLYITELILFCFRNVLVSFPIQGLFSHLTCGWLVLPFILVVPLECQIQVPLHWEAREGLWLWGDASHQPDLTFGAALRNRSGAGHGFPFLLVESSHHVTVSLASPKDPWSAGLEQC